MNTVNKVTINRFCQKMSKRILILILNELDEYEEVSDYEKAKPSLQKR